MAKLASNPKWEIEYTMSETNQLNPSLPRHIVTHCRKVQLRAPPSNTVCGQVAHPSEPPFLIQGID
ncbi:hypothetical protein HYC85_029231 [Camellia sinensis]|uniref:Uncharacterized protein n=1 Tax=Camellia sinensis TaxID=4442 RepID=A0A7J7FXE5_CAMSI|nr:hypothetical protein HYC85_029231 [Camellia sinensis]